MKQSDKNNLLYITAYALRSAALLTATGTLMQTFLSVIGMTADMIYIHTTAVGAINVLIILLFARFADTADIIKRTFFVMLAGAFLFLAYLPLCSQNGNPVYGFILLLAAGCMQSVTTALHTVCDYKLPYYIIKKDEYGRIMALCGILYSGISFGTGALMTALSMKYDYTVLMFCAFIAAFILSASAGFLTLKLKNIAPIHRTPEKKHGIRNPENSIKTVIFSPVFYKLIPANLIRGFSSGLTLIFAVIAADNLGYSEQINTAAVSVQSIASLGACALFAVLSKHISPRISVFAGSLTFLLLPLILIPEKPVLFLVLTGIIMFGRTLIDYAVPSLLLYAVPVSEAGPYNAYRMLLHNGGSLLATSLAAVISPSVLLPLGAVFQVISGTVYLTLPLLKKASPLKVR